MNNEEKVEKLNATFYKEKPNKKNHSPIIFFIFVIFLFISYLFFSVFFITIGIVSIIQSIFGGNLFNGFNSMGWGLVLLIIGIFMILPIIRYFKNIYSILKIQYLINKNKDSK